MGSLGFMLENRKRPGWLASRRMLSSTFPARGAAPSREARPTEMGPLTGEGRSHWHAQWALSARAPASVRALPATRPVAFSRAAARGRGSCVQWPEPPLASRPERPLP
jgi:hypothetical protein